MSDITIGGIKLELGGDVRGLREAVQAGKVSVEDLGKFLEQRLDKASTSAERSVARLVKELTGIKPTASLEQLAVAVEKIGGVSALSATQQTLLAERVKRLAAAGGTVPPVFAAMTASMQSATTSGATFGTVMESQATKGMQGLAASLGPAASALSTLGPLFLAGAVAVGAFGIAISSTASFLASAAESAVAHGSRISDLGARFDFSTDAIQKFDYAASLVGSQVETLVRAAMKLDSALVNTPDKFRQLGLNATDLKKLEPDKLFTEVAEALANVDDRTQRNVLSSQLLGKSWRETAAIMRAMSQGAGDAAQRRGIVMAPETLANLDAVDDAITGLSKTWDHFKMNIGAALVASPELARSIEAVSDLLGAASVRVMELGPEVTAVVGMLADSISDAISIASQFNDVSHAVFGESLPRLLLNATGDVTSLTIAFDAARAEVMFWANTMSVAQAMLSQTELPSTNKAAKRSGFDPQKMMAPNTGDVAGPTAAENTGQELAIKRHIEALKIENDVEQISIRLTSEMAQARAALDVGLDAEIAKIEAATAGKVAQIASEEKYNASQKAQLISQTKALGDVQIAIAKEAAARTVAAVATAMHADAEKIANSAIEAGMTALERKVHAIEADRVAQIDATNALYLKTQAEKGESAALDASYAAKIRAINASAKGATAAAEEAAELSNLANATDTAAAAAKARDTMSKLFLEKEKHDLDELVATWNNLGNVLGGLGDLFGALGGRADSTIGSMLSGAEQATDIIARTQKQGFLSFGDMLSAGSSIAKSKNPLSGALEGGMIGAQFGPQGAAIGAALGAALGIAGKMVKTESEKIAADVGRDFGVKISDELAKTIEKEGKGRLDGALMHLGAIIKEAGGVEKFGAERSVDALHDVFSAVDRGTMSIQEAGAVFDETFGEIAAANISKTTGIATEKLRDLVDVARQFGIESQALREFLSGQASASVAGIGAGLAGMKSSREAAAKTGGKGVGLANQGAASGISAGIAVDFSQLIAGGMSAVEAAKAVAPAVAAMREELKNAGFEGSAAFNELTTIIDIVTGEISGPLVESIAGFTAGMVGLFNSGQLTSEMFAGMTAQVGANIAALEEQGIKGPAAIAVMQPQLQAIWEIQQRTGFAVDETTQKMIDEAVEAGAVGDAHKSAAERTADSMSLVVDVLKLVAEQLGVTKSKLDALGDKTINVKTNFSSTGNPPPGYDGPGGGGGDGGSEGPADDGSGIPQYAMGTGGIVNFGAQTIAALHGWEGVYTASQIDALSSSTFNAGAVAAMTAGGGMAGGGVDLGPVVAELRRMSQETRMLRPAIVDGMRDAVLVLPQR